jgi:hypothetical protein
VRFEQAFDAATCREDAVAADVAMAALYVAVGRPGDAQAFLARARSDCSCAPALASDESLLALIADFKARASDRSQPASEGDGEEEEKFGGEEGRDPADRQYAGEDKTREPRDSSSADGDDPSFNGWKCVVDGVEQTARGVARWRPAGAKVEANSVLVCSSRPICAHPPT